MRRHMQGMLDETDPYSVSILRKEANESITRGFHKFLKVFEGFCRKSPISTGRSD